MSESFTFFDACLTLGRTNRATPQAPCTEGQALALMDRYAVSEALVVHTVARDSDPELGNAALAGLASERLHRVWAVEAACVLEETPAAFLDRALAAGVKAFLFNPLIRRIRIDRSVRLRQLAALLERRRIPLLAVYRQWDSAEDLIDWYTLADFCSAFPRLPVIASETRTRANRPLFDALATAPNLKVSLASVWQSQMLDQICNSFGPHRVVFSLGLPLLDPGTFQAVVTCAGVSEEVKRAVAGGTMRALLAGADYG